MTQTTLMQLLDKNKEQLGNFKSKLAELVNTRALFYRKDGTLVLSERVNVSGTASTLADVVKEQFVLQGSLNDHFNSLVANMVKAEKATREIEIPVHVPFLKLDTTVTPTVAVKLRALFKELKGSLGFREFNLSSQPVDISNKDFSGWVEKRVFTQAELLDCKEQLDDAIQSIQSHLTVKNVQTLVDM
jgi:hypothetical protein